MKRLALSICIVAFGSFIVAGCYYDSVIEEAPQINEDVSFSLDVVPIFSGSCAIAGCHNTGGISPDLTSAKAYNELINGNYVNTGNPESSELYLWMQGSGGRTVMPPSGKNPTNNAIILAWIAQGAQNN